MSRYDLRFTIGIDQASENKFKAQLNELAKTKQIQVKFDYKELNLFKANLKNGFDTTVRFHADISELKRAVSQFNIRDIAEPLTVDKLISQQTLDLSEKRIQKLISSFDKLQAQKKKVAEAADILLGESQGRRYIGEFDKQNGYTISKGAFERNKNDTKALKQARQDLQSEAAAYLEQRNKTLSMLVSLEADPKMKEALSGLKPTALRSTKKFLSYVDKPGKVITDSLGTSYRESISDIVKNVTEFNKAMPSTALDELGTYQKEFKSLRTEVREFVKENNVSINSKGVIKGLDELSKDKLIVVNEMIGRMRELNKLMVSLGGNQQMLGASGNKNENQLFGALRTELENRVEKVQSIRGILATQSENVGTTVSAQAAEKVYKDLSGGLTNIPINSFAINPEAIEAIREAIQTQLANVTIGKTITLKPTAKTKDKQDNVVLPNVVIGSVELSSEAVTKLREDTQRALNNVTVEPTADEASFKQAFEEASKVYQNKLNTLGQKLSSAIKAPTIEEFDAKPAIEKLKAQINAALKSFKFDINGKVAHGTISTGLDEGYQYAYKTYESLESDVSKMVKGANANISKLTGWGNIAGSQDTLAKYNDFLNKIEQFKTAFRDMDADGKLTMPIDQANKRMAELVAEGHELEDSFNNIATRSSIDKTLSNTEKNVRSVLKSLDNYQNTDKVQNVRANIEGKGDKNGLLADIEALKTSLPTKTISEANTEMMALLSRVEQLNQEFSEVAANAPLTKELERAEADTVTLERRLVSLQEKMQKALSANSRGFSHAEYRTRYSAIYQATQTDDLNGEQIRVLDTRFRELMRDMREAGMTGKSFGDIMRGMYTKFGSWTMVTMTIQRVIMTFKRMVAAVQEVDTALTNLRKVTNATESDLQRFMYGVGDSAYRLGASISDLINATAEFSRLGYNLNQAQKLGELATMYKSVAEDLDITTASQSIVSTLKAFEKTGITAERIVDVFNYVGNNFAISSAGIGEAMQRSAASLQTANNSLEQSVALITAANEVAQDPIKVGTAMKTLSARIRGSKTELAELGEDMEFLAEGTSKLRKEILSLSGVDIMIDKNNFKSTYQIMDELSTAYQGMVETSQARLAELIGGKNQANIVSALLENFNTARKTLSDSTNNAEGSAERELETALDSINGKVNQLSATWQKFATDVLESDGFKVVIDGANTFIKVLDKLIGGSNTLIKLVPLVMAGFATAKKTNILSMLGGAKTSLFNLFGNQGLSRDELRAQLVDFRKNVFNATDITAARTQYFAQFTDGSRDILRDYVDSIDDINQASLNGVVAYQNQALAEMNVGASRYLTGLKNLAINAGVIVGTYFAAKLVDWAMEKLPFTEQHKQKVAELADKASSAFDEELNKNKNNTEIVNQMTEEFQRLSVGISSTGENISLTNEQYDKYKSYVSQLIEINPSLVQGINAQGEAFINNKTAIQETTKALNEQQRMIYALFVNGSDGEAFYENIIDKYEEARDKISGTPLFGSSLGEKLRSNLNYGFTRSDKLYGLLSSKDIESTDKDRLLNLLGIASEKEISDIVNSPEVFEFARTIERNRQEIINIAQKYDKGEVIQKNLDENRDILAQIDQQKEQMKQIGSELDDYVNSYARSNSKYYELSAQQTKLLDNYIKEYNLSEKLFTPTGYNELTLLPEYADEKTVENQMHSDVDNFIDFISGLSEESNKKISEIFTIDKATTKYNDYKKQRDNLINDIVNDPNYNSDLLSKEKLRVSLGIDFETDDGEIKNQYEDMLANIHSRFVREMPANAPFTSEVIKNIRESFTPEQITKLYNTESFAGLDSWDKVINYISAPKGFDASVYKDTIDNITKDLNTLGDALKKVKMGELTVDAKGATEEVMKLIQEFPELGEYVDFADDRFGHLQAGLIRVIETRPDGLLKSFDELGDLTDEARKKCDQYRKAIKNLQTDALGGNISYLVSKGLTEQDYLNYVTDNYDEIIKKLEEEKEQQQEINEELNEQKEQLDEIIDKYATAGSTVIKTIEDKISDVTDFYNEQIDKLKEENEELQRNIDLQEKIDALANARKTRVRVYSETQGWHYENDAGAIKKAEDELAKTQREIKISELEKQRDDEIKLWEDYKEAWQDAMDSYTRAHDEAITEGILGSDWRDNVMERDTEMLDNYRYNYEGFQRQLGESIDKQIKDNSKLTDSIDDKIKAYQKDKQALQDWVKDITDFKWKYFEQIDDIKLTENSSYEERIANLKEFKENYLRLIQEIAEANDSNDEFYSPTKITYNGKTMGTYISQEQAKDAIPQLAKSVADNRYKESFGSGKPEDMLFRILYTTNYRKAIEDTVKRLKIEPVGSYSSGGVINKTGMALVHGSESKSEVALNSSQAKDVYDFIQSGAMSKATSAMLGAYNALINALPTPSVSGVNIPIKGSAFFPDAVKETKGGNTNEINLSFPNAVINAKDYDTFKGFMDRYTNDLLLKMQVGL